MRITLYKSFLCPRCYLAKRYLTEIAATDPTITFEEVDILASPGRAWKERIRMIPALKVDNRIKSGLYLNKETILNFITNKNH